MVITKVDFADSFEKCLESWDKCIKEIQRSIIALGFVIFLLISNSRRFSKHTSYLDSATSFKFLAWQKAFLLSTLTHINPMLAQGFACWRHIFLQLSTSNFQIISIFSHVLFPPLIFSYLIPTDRKQDKYHYHYPTPTYIIYLEKAKTVYLEFYLHCVIILKK